MAEWWLTTWFDVGMVLLAVVVVYVAIIAFTRIAGLRSFSQMSAFDFAMTVAIGSMFASTIATKDPPVLQGLVAFGGLYAGQVVIALARRNRLTAGVIDNRPRLLMVHGEILPDALRAARVTEEDLRAKLREANVLQYHQVRAVVFETTGDVSVLSADDDTPLDPDLLSNVIGCEGLQSRRD